MFETKINSKGYYFDPEKKISFYLSIFKNFINLNDNVIRIRIAADGTQIGKNLTVLNISFAFLNEIKFPENKSKIFFYNFIINLSLQIIFNYSKENKNSSKKERQKVYRANREDCNFLLGCFNIMKEDYDEIKISMKELCESFKALKKLKSENG